MKSRTSLISFQALLVTLVLLLLAPSLARAEWLSTVSHLFYTFTMISCLYLVSQERKQLIIGFALFIPALITKWMLAPVLSAEIQLLVYCTLQVLFLIYVMRIVYNRLLSVRIVNQEIVYASVVLYLLFGVCMAIIYFGICIIEPSTFGEQIAFDVNDEHTRTEALHDLIYFSFVTQTTLGYGDMSPKLDLARTLATFQAILGQLYIAVVIARLVGIHIAIATMEENK